MFTEQEKNTIRKLINKMTECEIFYGKYDAKNGNEHFMYGINTVMEYLASLVDDEFRNQFSNTFTKNMADSKKKLDKLN